MKLDDAILSRTTLLLGENAMKRIEETRVLIFGVGGVGSWCAESLVRSGIRHLTIVDSDNVCVSNVNRQRMATVDTIGKVKVEALKNVLLTILPDAEIEIRQEVYCESTADKFNFDEYDYIIDAIDSLKDKILLIENATRSKAKFFSSMGAALKIDPTKIKVAEFWDVIGCPLARALRQRFKKLKRRPYKKFKCVYSEELLENKGSIEDITYASEEASLPLQSERDAAKSRVNGSIMHITAIFGLTIAGLVIKDIYGKQ